MSDRESVRELIKKYAKVKTGAGGDLLQCLSPLPEIVAVIGRHGGDDFIGTLEAEDVYHYQMLICELVKLCLRVHETEPASDRSWVARYAPLRQSLDMGIASEAEPVAGPSTSSFQQTVRWTSSQIYAPTPSGTPVLPVISEDTPLIVPPSSASQYETPGVMEFVRRSQRTINDRQLFDAPILDLFDLEHDDENLAEIERVVEANRRQRIELRHVGRRTRIVGIRTELNTLRPTTVTTAESVTSHDAYMYAEVMEYELIDTLQNEEGNVVVIPENTMETFLTELQRRRTTESLAFGIEEPHAVPIPVNTTELSISLQREGTSELPSIYMPEQLAQTSTQTIELGRLPNLQEESDQPLAEHSYVDALPPFESQQMNERLIETSPIVSPVNLRERNENRDGIYVESGVRQPRRRRRRVRRERAESSSPVPQQLPRRSHRRSELNLPPEVTPHLVPERGSEQVIQQGLHQEQSSLLRKFKQWQETISKEHETTWRHPNLMIDLRRIEQLFPETRNLLAILATNKHTPLAELLGINRKNSAQRFTILLELNTRGLVILKCNESCVVLGVENPHLNSNQEGA